MADAAGLGAELTWTQWSRRGCPVAEWVGDCSTVGAVPRSMLDAALNETQQALSTMIELLEGGGLERLSPDEELSWWHRFETFRNQLPLVDHNLIADAEASDLADSYGFSSMTRVARFYCIRRLVR